MVNENASTIKRCSEIITARPVAWQSQSSFGAVVTFNSSKEAEGFSAAVKGAAPKLSFVGLQSKSASDPHCGAEQ